MFRAYHADGTLKEGDLNLPRGAFNVYREAAVSYTSGSDVVFDTKELDVEGWYDPSTGRYTPQIAGYYAFTGKLLPAGGALADTNFVIAYLQKNGTTVKELGAGIASGTVTQPRVSGASGPIWANGTTDYFNIEVNHNKGSAMALQVGAGHPEYNYFGGYLVASASEPEPLGGTLVGEFAQATEGVRTNTAYGALDNGPDVVPGVVVPAGGGFVRVVYFAVWKNTVAGAGRAAIFIGSNQLKVGPVAGGVSAVSEVNIGGSSTTYAYLVTAPNGLAQSTGGDAASADPGTGIAVALSAGTPLGGACLIALPGGSYDISVQYKASSGSVSAKNRVLTAEVIG